MQPRVAKLNRDTKETRIRVDLCLDGKGLARVSTGIPFFDHMLNLFARHAVLDLKLRCRGDLDVDAHHTVEDCGIALGQAFRVALGEKRGLRRYGAGFDRSKRLYGESYVPMDESLVRCVIDFGGRPFLVWKGFDRQAYKVLSKRERRQDMSTRFRFGLAREFFQAFANEARCNLHLQRLDGDEPHHLVEAAFKAWARAVDQACRLDSRLADQIPSTKGTL
jgi:imidazoleglycerol-phosphate dehydratase